MSPGLLTRDKRLIQFILISFARKKKGPDEPGPRVRGWV